MSITLTYSGNSITIQQPYFGYSTEIVMGLHYSKTTSGYKIGDDGAAYDYRICNIPVWMLDYTDQLALSDFFNDITKGRGNNFTMTLASGSGFFPFGADKGDEGSFTCSLLDHQKGGVIQQPYLQHENSFKVVLVTAPAYTPASAEDEGGLSIGTVTTLRPFQVFPRPTNYQNIVREITRGGVVGSVDIGSTADFVETDIDLEMREGNCAALITYLTTTRNSQFNITGATNQYLFGIDYSYDGTYTVKNLTNRIIITHDNYDRFTTSLKLFLVSAIETTDFELLEHNNTNIFIEHNNTNIFIENYIS